MLIFGIRVEYEKWTSVFLMRSVKTIKRKYFIKKEKKKKNILAKEVAVKRELLFDQGTNSLHKDIKVSFKMC